MSYWSSELWSPVSNERSIEGSIPLATWTVSSIAIIKVMWQTKPQKTNASNHLGQKQTLLHPKTSSLKPL